MVFLEKSEEFWKTNKLWICYAKTENVAQDSMTFNHTEFGDKIKFSIFVLTDKINMIWSL